MITVEGDVEVIGGPRNTFETGGVKAVTAVGDDFTDGVAGCEYHRRITDVTIGCIVVHRLGMGDAYVGFNVGDESLDHVSHVGIVVVDVDLLLTSGKC